MKEKYTIRRADISESGMVMRFLHDYWKPTFILSQSEQFMRWQHVYEDEFCYLIAQNGRTGEIDGLIGYIPYSNSIPRDIFGALWKVKDDASPGLGLRMRLALSRMPGTRSLSAIGLNPNTLNLHRRCGSMVDSLKHYYILSDIDRFRIAQIEIRPNCLFNNSLKQYSLVCTKSIEKIGYAIEIGRAMGRQPYKSLEFIIHRYINHPIYKYMLY